MWRCVLFVLIFAGLLVPAQAALRARVVADGFDAPVFATAPVRDSRLFVAEQSGRIRILELDQGRVKPTPFLVVRNILAGGEQGLLGLAFDPDYATNGFLYVNVTRASDGATEIRRYQVSKTNPDRADPASERLILQYAQPFANHNGGWLGFGPDGLLYIAAGDGGSGNDPDNNAQNPNVLLGKILRIDVRHPSGGRAYGIPAGNPFATGGGAPEVWDYGLRNPWRCSFDRATGDLWIGDVGQSTREEVDLHPAGEAGGKNFGWRVFEGAIRTPGISDSAPGNAVGPVHDYQHDVGQAIIGGYVCRFPLRNVRGLYIFGDAISGRIWTFRPRNGRATRLRDRSAQVTRQHGIPGLSSFGEDGAGRIYAVSLSGRIYRFVTGSSRAKERGD